jgi:hypothetical protein
MLARIHNFFIFTIWAYYSEIVVVSFDTVSILFVFFRHYYANIKPVILDKGFERYKQLGHLRNKKLKLYCFILSTYHI